MNFLRDFTKRMKSVGRFSVLLGNSMNKTTWKQYGIETVDEQVNMLFTVLLYIMEQSLKEETCTIDDIAFFIGEICEGYYELSLSLDDSKALADFIVNVILSNSGAEMTFQGYDYENREYKDIHIDYIGNRIVYQENGIRRTSYYLTDDGYNMMLSTMELENNLKMTVHEMLFKLHLEKADYKGAVNDIKNVFEQLRIQTQKIQESMRKIRQNALSYTVEEYREIVEENMATLEDTRERFHAHKENVESCIKKYEEDEISTGSIEGKEKDNLNNLKVIVDYLNRALDEHQKILGKHFDLKALYTKELENYSNMTLVKRYHFRTELYDKVLSDARILNHLNEIFTPLFQKSLKKVYHPGKAFEPQKKIRGKKEEEEVTFLGIDETEYRQEQEQIRREKRRKYKASLELLIEKIREKNGITLGEVLEHITEEEKQRLFPSLEVFREILIELLTEQIIDIQVLKEESKEYIMEEANLFELNEMLLEIVEENEIKEMKVLHIVKAEESKRVRIENIKNEQGQEKNILCSDIEFWFTV